MVMRALPSSLLVVILAATIGLGWLFDGIYRHYFIPVNNAETIDDVIESFGQHIASTVDGHSDMQALVDDWPVDGSFSLSLQSLNNLSMPKSLVDSIKQGQPLALESTSGVSFYYFLPSSEQVLILKSALLLQNQKIQQSNYWFTALFYFILLMLFMLWALPLVKRLLELRKVTNRLGQGDLSERIPLSRISYIRDIEIAFNRMAQQIETLVSDIKLLSTGVSHDLRTPLARIRFGLDTLQEEDDPVLQSQYLRKVGANVDDMTRLVETLLDYTRLDQTLVDIQKQDVNLSLLAGTVVKTSRNEIKKLSLNCASDDFIIKGDSRFLSMLINNLVHNAIRYGKGHVVVSLNKQQGDIVLSVEDNGNGIAKEHISALFKPFVRGETLINQTNTNAGDTRNPNSGQGYGVGLAVVKRIADWHQANIVVDRSPTLDGARFTLCFPSI
jgi:two-component system, OmpR family, sensor kinase